MPSPSIKASRLETPLHDSDYEEPHETVTSAAAAETASMQGKGTGPREPKSLSRHGRTPQLHWGTWCKVQLPPFPKVTQAICNPHVRTTPSTPQGLPAASLFVGLKIIKPKTCPLPDQKKLNETETSLAWGHLMLALSASLH